MAALHISKTREKASQRVKNLLVRQKIASEKKVLDIPQRIASPP
jgi:hypothetical protein